MPVTTGSPATVLVIRAEAEQPGGRGSNPRWLGWQSETSSGFRHPQASFRQGGTAQVIQLNEQASTGTPAAGVQQLKGLLHSLLLSKTQSEQPESLLRSTNFKEEIRNFHANTQESAKS